MARNRIEIHVTERELDERRARWKARDAFKEPDRVPVLMGIGTRYWLPKLGLSFHEYFSSAEVMFNAQVTALEWVFSNVRDDRYSIAVGPDFQNVREASGLGCDIGFHNGFPWVERPVIREESDVERLTKRDMYTDGLTGRIASYRIEMKNLSEGARAKLKDGTTVPIEVGSGMGTDGPFTNCAWLRGSTQLLADVRLRPSLVHSMMTVVTERIIDFNQRLREDAGLAQDCGMGVADDFAAFLSADHYREFVLPYHEKIYDAFGTKARDIHLCGKIDHLLELLVDEQRIHGLSGFGWVTDVRELARVMGGRVLLYGGPNPSLILHGPKSRIIESAQEYLRVLAPCHGYALGDGYNVAPGTPTDHMNALMEAAEISGKYPMREG